MSTAAVDVSTPALPGRALPGRALPGRVDVSARALERTVQAVAASALGADIRDVSVRLSDVEGKLNVAVAAPIGMKPLATSASEGLRILSSLRDSRDAIGVTASQLTGRTISTVTVRITRAIVSERRRVS